MGVISQLTPAAGLNGLSRPTQTSFHATAVNEASR